MNFHVSKNGEIISSDIRALISKRYRAITKAVNREFWNSNSETAHTLYVGSYGRGTAVDSSDIDILVELPELEYEHYDRQKGNGQSRLLQAVKEAIQGTYSRTDIRADGQVVKVSFTDMKFEVLPAFKIGNNSYLYPDTNMGGNWLSTNPKSEQDAMHDKNSSSRGLLFDTCKHMRRIRDKYYSSYHLSGIVIDSFAYEAIGNYAWSKNANRTSISNGKYEDHLYDYFVNNYRFASTITAPGSKDEVDLIDSIECLERVLYKISHRK